MNHAASGERSTDAKEGAESLAFRPSEHNTLGVELELQIIDPQTGDLAPGSVRILKVCEQEGLSGVTAELMQSMIEIRVCDMPPTLAMTLGVVALIHGLVISTQRLLQERPHLCRGDIRRHWIAIENKWLAARYGLQARHIRTPSGKRRLLSQDLADVVERLKPIAEETGDAPFLGAIRPTESFESGADRQRRLFRESGDWKRLADDMTERWGQEL